jgi:carboxymethylenebutenolidase
MSIRMFTRIRGAVLASAVAVLSLAPVVAPAQGIGSFFSSLTIRQGIGSFTAPTGCPVTVEHFLPRCDNAPAVIILHGSDGPDRYATTYRNIGRALAANGYAAFFVHYLDGTPNIPPPDPYAHTLPAPRAFAAWMGVNAAAVSYVQNFCGVDPNRVGITGFSLGAYIATSLASNDPRIKVLIETSGGIPPQFANFKHMPPTLIIHGQCDDTVPVSEAYRLHGLMWKRHLCNQMLILPGEGHVPFNDESNKTAAEVGLEFLNGNL